MAADLMLMGSGPLCLCLCVCVHVYVCGVKRVLLSHPVGSLKVFARRNT